MNLYPYFKQVCLDKGNTDSVDMNSDTIKLALLEGYSYDSADKYLSDVIADGTVVARSGALASPTVTNGTFGAANETLSAVTTGHTVTSFVLYKDTGTDSTCTLICHVDKQADGTTAISLPTNGSDVLVTFNAGGIFDL
jgi:DNA mismatch repair ATPase MutS